MSPSTLDSQLSSVLNSVRPRGKLVLWGLSKGLCTPTELSCYYNDNCLPWNARCMAFHALSSIEILIDRGLVEPIPEKKFQYRITPLGKVFVESPNAMAAPFVDTDINPHYRRFS